MRIAVVFHGNPQAGGGFHDGLTATLLTQNLRDEYQFVYYSTRNENAKVLKELGLRVKLISFGRKERIIYRLRKKLFFNHWFYKFGIFPSVDAQFEKDQIDLIYFTGPNSLCLFLERLNYILPVWDLCHRDHPELPEVRQHFEFDARENFLRSALPKASAVIAESPFGKEALIRRYGLDSEKVYHIWKPASAKILSLAKNKRIDPRDSHGIPAKAKFVFYPAQFWPHKNHRLIIDAIAYLKNEYDVEIFSVFCGSDCGNLNPIRSYSKKLGVDHLIIHLGFISDEEIPHLYRESLALVMPSIFGPTNMPPIEAFHFGTPVVVANLPGFDNQVGDAAILVDPYDHKDLGEIIHRFSQDENFRQDIIDKGKNRAELYSDNERIKTLKSIFTNYRNKQKLWRFE